MTVACPAQYCFYAITIQKWRYNYGPSTSSLPQTAPIGSTEEVEDLGSTQFALVNCIGKEAW